MIWVISDQQEESWSLLTLARDFNEEQNCSITAFVTGNEEAGQLAFEYGADRVRLLVMPAETTWEQYVRVLGDEALTQMPGLILVSASPRGQTLAAQLSALLDCPCLSSCHCLSGGPDGKIYAERFTMGGRCIEKITAFNRTIVVTVPVRTIPASKCLPAAPGEISPLLVPANDTVILRERVHAPKPKMELEKAPVVVGVGRGLTSLDNLYLAEELAAALGGVLACSRSVAEDLHWLPAEIYLGITGRTVKPRLYLALGISGQPQHLFGVRDAGMIVAINNNVNAPIVNVSDYFIKADLQEFLPVLVQVLTEGTEG